MSPFELDDYKEFFRRWIRSLPKNGRGEVNRLAAHLSVHGTLVSQVLSGPKDFTGEQLFKLCRYVGLSHPESDYLLLLLQRDRAGTVEFRKHFEGKIRAAKKESLSVAKRLEEHRALSDSERAIFYSSWIYSAVRLFSSIEPQSVEAVAKRFSLTRAKASEVLSFLRGAGLCLESNGLFTMGPQHTHLEFGSPFLRGHHGNWRLKAIDAVETLGEKELMFTAPFSISRADFEKIREDIIRLIQSLADRAKASEAEDVACVNLDLFWVRD